MAKTSGQWSGFRSVLCAIDFSEHSRLALRHAAAVARRANGQLTAIYVNEPLLIAAAAVALHDRHLAEQSAVELQAFVKETLSPFTRQQLRVRALVSVGQPAHEILRAVDRNRSDLIVLGTHGLTGASRMLMGSTTLGVLRRTTVPVLAVPRAEQGPTTVAQSWPGRRLVAAIEIGATAPRDIDVASRLAQWFESPLLLLHVVPGLAVPAWIHGNLTAHERIRIAQAEQRLQELASVARRRIKTRIRVACGNAADEIATVTASEQAGLLITALSGEKGRIASGRGSVSYAVLVHATSPVLAYPPLWQPR